MNPIRIGPYELLDPLGEGGMGRVYRARDTRLGRIVAIKFLQAKNAADQRRQLRFLREAKAEAALSHPNLATLLDVGEAEVDDPAIAPPREPGEATATVPYLVLEFVPGRDLHELLRDGPLPLGELLRIARQVAAGLRAAHAAGVIHRDLKPGNVRVTPDGRVKILDFGLALFIEGAAPTSDSLTELATSEGMVVGTVPYLAPEQAAGATVDARADLFSLGVLLYELACGELPFRGVSTVDRLRAVLQDTPPPLLERATGIPERLADLVHRLLAKEPGDRPRDAAEVEQALELISRECADAPTSLTLPSRFRPRVSGLASATRARRRLSPRSAIALGVCALLALAALTYLVLDRRSLAEARRLIAEGRRAEQIADPQALRIAASSYERATTVRPDLAAAWTALSEALASSYAEEHRPELLDRAVAAARRAFELAPGAPEVRVAQAQIERMRGDPRRAVELLESIPKQGDAVDRLERELANAWAALGDKDKAEGHLLAAVAANPKNWINWNALGIFRVQHANYPGARNAFEEAEGLTPEGVTQARENLAAVLFLEGKYPEALAAYERIQGRVASPDSASNMGTLYFMNGRMPEAERSFREAIRMSPRDPIFHRNLADTLMRTGRDDEARAEYEEALRLADVLLADNPKDPALRLQRTLYLARSGQCAAAIAAARELESEQAPTASLLHQLARPYALCAAPAEAMERLEQAVALGFPAAPLADEDELAPLRGNARFQRLIAGHSPTAD